MEKREFNPLAALMRFPWWLAVVGGLFVAMWAGARLATKLKAVQEPACCEDE
ncbi:MAG TPA: hypothetical protein GXX23_04695 [Firmicutes bacterium]|nr:hypothetical protein [Candidatus Fermentithermobacillaceae bacterium]